MDPYTTQTRPYQMGSATYNVLVSDSRNPVSYPDAGYTIGANKKMRCVGVDEYSGAQELSVSAYIQFNDGHEVSKRRVRAEVDVLEDTAIFSYLAAAVEPAWPQGYGVSLVGGRDGDSSGTSGDKCRSARDRPSGAYRPT
ncbi:hypothetical protein SAPIO_CDS3948 [Scedosporium apiospermum]|uniref:Uncharacterized protein n=1 Tax=Pseudallescheria apiosperma TaxID=563466 RepID=A0A084G8Y7_PSEDA|nr:uncharacterized protein SAPIO_CDS3948 [Scedosporium apiospermum]KEZ43799.1 hypothetical protein SAPIO_CDS3948 [Scedosporium apiospermum]